MKAELRSPLMLVGGTLFAVWLGIHLGWETPAPALAQIAQEDESRPAPDETAVELDEVDAEQILDRCLDTLWQAESLEVGVRQEVAVFGQRISGTGRYLQQGRGGERTRLEMKLSAGPAITDLLQIRTGRFIYTRLRTPQEHRVTQVDLDRARHELASTDRPSREPRSALVGGGLLRLIRTLRDDFRFGPPESIEWGGQRVWRITGRWRDEALESHYGRNGGLWNDGEGLATWAPQVPTHVVLVIGVDPQLPYFPYRIDLMRQATPGDQPRLERVCRIDLHGIRHRVELDTALFDYEPEDEAVVDETTDFVARIEGGAARR